MPVKIPVMDTGNSEAITADVGIDDINDPFEPTIHDSKANPTTPEEEPLIFDTQNGTPMELAVSEPSARCSSQTRQATQSYVPSMTDKKYSYAGMQLDQQRYDHLFATMEENETPFDLRIVEFVFSQQMISAAMKLWGAETTVVAMKEMKQLHSRNCFQPVHWNDLSMEQRKTVLESHIIAYIRPEEKSWRSEGEDGCQRQSTTWLH